MKNIDIHKHEAMLYDHLGNNSVICNLCTHNCNIQPEKYGFCQTRYNDKGKLLALSWGNIDAYALDPIEKKPLYHFKPGSKVFSFATGGCNLKCQFCQNCELSQYIYHYERQYRSVSPKDLLSVAAKLNPDGFSYTYSEPTMFFEYIIDFIDECKKGYATKNLFHTYISNGQFSPELLEFLKTSRLFDAFNFDLKFINNSKYQKYTRGNVLSVLNAIETLIKISHIEVTNLIIPGVNDSILELRELCHAVAEISSDIPLHFSRFFPRYHFMDKEITPIETLHSAFNIAKEEGLKYVYLGNINPDKYSNTYCPNCSELLIERNGFEITSHFADKSNTCPKCGYQTNIIL